MIDRMIADFILAESCEESGQAADIVDVYAREVSFWKSICKWDIHSEEDVQKKGRWLWAGVADSIATRYGPDGPGIESR